MLAYAVATQRPSGVLIYAAGEDEPAVHEVVHLGQTLETIALNLDRPPEQILQQVGVLARRIEENPSVAA